MTSPKRFTGTVKQEDIDLLVEMYKIRSCSKYEQEMVKFVQKYIKEHVPTAVVETDAMGNMLITKGVLNEGCFYPCVAAHMDIVSNHATKATDIINVAHYTFVDKSPGTIFGCTKTNEYGAVSKIGGAGDDKNGVFICLRMLEQKDVIKVALFVQEEIGCVGARAVDVKWFENCAFALECDRKNSGDLIVTYNGKPVISDEFESLLIPIAREYGFKKETGSVTDVMTLKTRGVDISVMNYSSGYYCAHTVDEYTVVEELITSMYLCSELIDKIPLSKRYEHKYEVYVAPKSYSTNYNDDLDEHYDYYSHYSKNACTCTAAQKSIGIINSVCNICNPVVQPNKVVYKCSCGKDTTRRKYSFNCECGKVVLQVKNYLSRK